MYFFKLKSTAVCNVTSRVSAINTIFITKQNTHRHIIDDPFFIKTLVYIILLKIIANLIFVKKFS